MSIITGLNESIGTASTTLGLTANTVVRVNVIPPASLAQFSRYRVGVQNTSGTTALTVKVMARENFGTSGTYGELTRFSVNTAVNGPVFKNVEGWLVGVANTSGQVGRLDISNDTLLAAGGRLTVRVGVRKV